MEAFQMQEDMMKLQAKPVEDPTSGSETKAEDNFTNAFRKGRNWNDYSDDDTPDATAASSAERPKVQQTQDSPAKKQKMTPLTPQERGALLRKIQEELRPAGTRMHTKTVEAVTDKVLAPREEERQRRRAEQEDKRIMNPILRVKEKSAWGDDLHKAIEKGYLIPDELSSLDEIMRFRDTIKEYMAQAKALEMGLCRRYHEKF